MPHPENANRKSQDFADMNLSGRNFSRQNLRGAVFKGANLKGANFSQANLSGADFSDAILRKANFAKANLTSAKFDAARAEYANLAGADLSRASCRAARFIRADLTMANLSEADLTGANLSEAIAKQATLKKTNLQQTLLHSTTFHGAVLTEANLVEAQFKQTIFSQAILAGASVSETALRQDCHLLGATLPHERVPTPAVEAVGKPTGPIAPPTVAHQAPSKQTYRGQNVASEAGAFTGQKRGHIPSPTIYRGRKIVQPRQLEAESAAADSSSETAPSGDRRQLTYRGRPIDPQADGPTVEPGEQADSGPSEATRPILFHRFNLPGQKVYPQV